jgi:hypothetical protein
MILQRRTRRSPGPGYGDVLRTSPGPSFWAYAVASGPVTLSPAAAEPADEACRELLEVHSAFYGPQDEDEFSPR